MDEVKSEINGQCDRLGIEARMYDAMGAGTWAMSVERILLYLLLKADCNLDAYDAAPAFALISPAEHEKCLASIKSYEDWKAAKAVAV